MPPIRPLAPLLAVAALLCGNLSAVEKPNILFLFADDQCYETIRALGHTDIDTPNLDRLVARGATFTQAYNMGSWSGAVCVASRTMLVTGRTLWRAAEIYEGSNTDAEREAGRLWPQRMSGAGYETYFTGKWHVKTDAAKCFDHSANIRGGMPKDVPAGYSRPLAGQPDPWSPSDPRFGGFWEGGRHWSEVVGDDAIGFLGQAAESEKPFFMYIAFNAPHDPRQSPQEYVDRYPLERVSVPSNFLTEYPHKDAIGCGPGLRDEKLAPFPRTEHAVKVHRQEYYAIITHMDAQIGRILDALEESGKAENTWIFFTADHGLAVGQHGLFGKQNMYEHSLRVPFLVNGPGVEAGSTVAAPIHLQDVMATALDLAGADREGVEFRSLLPLLKGEGEGEGKGLEAVYAAYLELQRAVVDEGWKLILYPKAKVARLYHLAEDPLETKDLAGDPAMVGRKKSLFAKLRELQREYEDALDLEAVYPELR
jgi:arylsulfatase A-like enzyme